MRHRKHKDITRTARGRAFSVRSAPMSRGLTGSTNGSPLADRLVFQSRQVHLFLPSKCTHTIRTFEETLPPPLPERQEIENRQTAPTTGKTMSGSAAPKSTKAEQTFEPDFKAKEMVETDETWFQKRFGTQQDDRVVAGATGKATESSRGQQKRAKKTRRSKCIAS